MRNNNDSVINAGLRVGALSSVLSNSARNVDGSFSRLGDVAGETSNALSGTSSTLGKTTSELNQAMSKLGSIFLLTHGPMTAFLSAISVAGMAVTSFHDRLNVARSAGGGLDLSRELQNLSIKTLLDPAQLKALSDDMSQSFSMSLTNNQKELERLALKSRLDERVMGKDYADDARASMGELKEAFYASSPTEMLNKVSSSTSILAKTLGVSNKIALDQIKAITKNTKELIGGDTSDMFNAANEGFMEASSILNSMGVSAEAQKHITTEATKQFSDSEIHNTFSRMTNLMNSNDKGGEFIRAQLEQNGISQQEFMDAMAKKANGRLLDEKDINLLTKAGTLGVAAQAMSQADLADRGRHGDVEAENRMRSNKNIGYTQDSEIANISKKLTVEQMVAKGTAGKANFELNKAAEANVESLNTVIAGLGVKSLEEKDAFIKAMSSGDNTEQASKLGFKQDEFEKSMQTAMKSSLVAKGVDVSKMSSAEIADKFDKQADFAEKSSIRERSFQSALDPEVMKKFVSDSREHDTKMELISRDKEGKILDNQLKFAVTGDSFKENTDAEKMQNTQLKMAGTGPEDLANNIETTMKRIMQKFENVVMRLVGKVLPSVEKAVGWLDDNLDRIANNLGSAFDNWIMPVFRGIGQIYDVTLKPAVDKFVNWIGGEGTDKLGHGLDKFKNFVSNAFDKYILPGATVVGKFFNETLIPLLGDVFGGFGDWFSSSALPHIENAFGSFGTWFSNDLTPEFGKTFDGFTTFFSNDVMPGLKAVFDAFGGWFDSQDGSMFKTIGNWFTDMLKEVRPELTKFGKWLKDDLAPNIKPAMEKISEVFSKVAAVAIPIIEWAFHTLWDVLSWTVPKIIPAFEYMGDWADKHVFPLIDKMKEFGARIWSWLEPFFGKTGDGTGDKVIAVLTGAADAVGWVLDKVRDNFEILATAIAGIAAAIVLEKALIAGGKVVKAVGNAGNNVMRAGRGVVDTVGGAASRHPKIVKGSLAAALAIGAVMYSQSGHAAENPESGEATESENGEKETEDKGSTGEIDKGVIEKIKDGVNLETVGLIGAIVPTAAVFLKNFVKKDGKKVEDKPDEILSEDQLFGKYVGNFGESIKEFADAMKSSESPFNLEDFVKKQKEGNSTHSTEPSKSVLSDKDAFINGAKKNNPLSDGAGSMAGSKKNPLSEGAGSMAGHSKPANPLAGMGSTQHTLPSHTPKGAGALTKIKGLISPKALSSTIGMLGKFAKFAGPIGAALGAAGSGAVGWSNAGETFKDSDEMKAQEATLSTNSDAGLKLAESLSKTGKAMWDGTKYVDEFGKAIEAQPSTLQKMAGATGSMISDFSFGLIDAQTASEASAKVFSWLGTVITDAWNGIVKFFTKTAPTLLMGAVTSIWDGVVKFFTETAPTLLMGAVTSIWNGVTNYFTEYKNNLMKVFEGYLEVFTAPFKALKAWFTGEMTFTEAMSTAWEGIKGGFVKVFDGITELIKLPFKSLINLILKGVSKIPGFGDLAPVDETKPAEKTDGEKSWWTTPLFGDSKEDKDKKITEEKQKEKENNKKDSSWLDKLNPIKNASAANEIPTNGILPPLDPSIKAQMVDTVKVPEKTKQLMFSDENLEKQQKEKENVAKETVNVELAKVKEAAAISEAEKAEMEKTKAAKALDDLKDKIKSDDRIAKERAEIEAKEAEKKEKTAKALAEKAKIEKEAAEKALADAKNAASQPSFFATMGTFFSSMAGSAQSAVSSTTSSDVENIKQQTANVVDSAYIGAQKTFETVKGTLTGKPADNKKALLIEMAKEGISNPKEQAMLMAQVSTESGNFKYTKELGKDSYFDKYDAGTKKGAELGNTEKGDGAKYKGRGLIQLTGKANYAAASKDLGIDLVNNPELAESPEVAAKTAMWYWKKRKGLRESAQDGNVLKSTKLVNGGPNHLNDRQNYYTSYLAEAQSGKLTTDINTAASNNKQPTLLSKMGNVLNPIKTASADKMITGSTPPLAPEITQQMNANKPYFIGDSITDGYKIAAKGTGDTTVGANPKTILAKIKEKLDKDPNFFKGKNVNLSTGLSNNTEDTKNIEEQLKLLKAAGANASVYGVANDFKGDASKGEAMNKKLEELSTKYGMSFKGGFKSSKDKVHPASYSEDKKADAAAKQSVSAGLKPEVLSQANSPFVTGDLQKAVGEHTAGIVGDVNAALYAGVNDNIKRGVKSGNSRNSATGAIDCSGFVLEQMECVRNAINDPSQIDDAMKAMKKGNTAAGITEAVAKLSGKELTGKDVNAANLKEGMTIGINNDDAKNNDRYKGIDHIAQVVKDPNTGELMVSHSGSKGPTMVPVEKFLKQNEGHDMTAVDPLYNVRGNDSQLNQTNNTALASVSPASPTTSAIGGLTFSSGKGDTNTILGNILNVLMKIAGISSASAAEVPANAIPFVQQQQAATTSAAQTPVATTPPTEAKDLVKTPDKIAAEKQLADEINNLTEERKKAGELLKDQVVKGDSDEKINETKKRIDTYDKKLAELNAKKTASAISKQASATTPPVPILDKPQKTNEEFVKALKENTKSVESGNKYDMIDPGDPISGQSMEFGAYQMTADSGNIDKYLKELSRNGDNEAENLVKVAEAAGGFEKLLPEQQASMAAFLQKSGNTDAGKAAQDKVFEENYIKPAQDMASKAGITDQAAIAQIVDQLAIMGEDNTQKMVNSAKDSGDLTAKGLLKIRKKMNASIVGHDLYAKDWDERAEKLGETFKDFEKKENPVAEASKTPASSENPQGNKEVAKPTTEATNAQAVDPKAKLNTELAEALAAKENISENAAYSRKTGNTEAADMMDALVSQYSTKIDDLQKQGATTQKSAVEAAKEAARGMTDEGLRQLDSDYVDNLKAMENLKKDLAMQEKDGNDSGAESTREKMKYYQQLIDAGKEQGAKIPQKKAIEASKDGANKTTAGFKLAVDKVHTADNRYDEMNATGAEADERKKHLEASGLNYDEMKGIYSKNAYGLMLSDDEKAKLSKSEESLKAYDKVNDPKQYLTGVDLDKKKNMDIHKPGLKSVSYQKEIDALEKIAQGQRDAGKSSSDAEDQIEYFKDKKAEAEAAEKDAKDKEKSVIPQIKQDAENRVSEISDATKQQTLAPLEDIFKNSNGLYSGGVTYQNVPEKTEAEKAAKLAALNTPEAIAARKADKDSAGNIERERQASGMYKKKDPDAVISSIQQDAKNKLETKKESNTSPSSLMQTSSFGFDIDSSETFSSLGKNMDTMFDSISKNFTIDQDDVLDTIAESTYIEPGKINETIADSMSSGEIASSFTDMMNTQIPNKEGNTTGFKVSSEDGGLSNTQSPSSEEKAQKSSDSIFSGFSNPITSLFPSTKNSGSYSDAFGTASTGFGNAIGGLGKGISDTASSMGSFLGFDGGGMTPSSSNPILEQLTGMKGAAGIVHPNELVIPSDLVGTVSGMAGAMNTALGSMPGTSGSIPSSAQNIPVNTPMAPTNQMQPQPSSGNQNKTTPNTPNAKIESLLEQILAENRRQSQSLGISSREASNQTKQATKSYKSAIDRADMSRQNDVSTQPSRISVF